MPDHISGSLSENLITCLAYSDEYGKVICNLVPAELYEGSYRLVAERCIDFWRRESRAPAAHVSDLFADILEDEHDRRAASIRRMLLGMLELSQGINGPYVIRQITTHIRGQRMRQAILAAAEALEGPLLEAERLTQVDQIFSEIGRARDIGFDRGLTLADVDRALADDEHSGEFDFGVPVLDQAGVAPERGTLTTLIAPSTRGKSWFLVHVGKRAFLRRRKVLHITLELSMEKTVQRYYQALYGVPRRDVERVDVATLDWNEDTGRLVGIGRDAITPEFTLRSPDRKTELATRGRLFGSKIFNVSVKEFPQNSLTLPELEGFIDQMELLHNFIPDMLIVDYPKIMRTSTDKMRFDIGNLFSGIRGICQKRNMAGVVVHQGNRSSFDARLVRETHAGEDISVVQHSDIVLTYSATGAERENGLARLLVDKARDAARGQQILITQSYDIGQFVIDSAPLQSVYYDYLEDLAQSTGEGNEDEGG